MQPIKQRLQNGETLLGTWLNLGNPLTAEIVGQAGYDWVIIDLEHGSGNEQDAIAQMQALSASATAAFVRVEVAARQRVHRVLDFGAQGIMFPHINDAASAQEAHKMMMYPPMGNRGVAKMIRAAGYGRSFDEYLTATQHLLGIMQIETQRALDHVEAIAALDGVDVLFIGPADLSMDMGIFGQFNHPMFLNALKKTVAAAEKYNKTVGILVANPEQLPAFKDLGLRFLACGSDGNFMVQASSQNLESMKKHLGMA